jgi:hypothetical protein
MVMVNAPHKRLPSDVVKNRIFAIFLDLGTLFLWFNGECQGLEAGYSANNPQKERLNEKIA